MALKFKSDKEFNEWLARANVTVIKEQSQLPITKHIKEERGSNISIPWLIALVIISFLIYVILNTTY